MENNKFIGTYKEYLEWKKNKKGNTNGKSKSGNKTRSTKSRNTSKSE